MYARGALSPVAAPQVRAEALVDVATADLPLIMTPAELARILRLSPKTLERWRASGKVPRAHQMPDTNRWCYARGGVMAWWDGIGADGTGS